MNYKTLTPEIFNKIEAKKERILKREAHRQFPDMDGQMEALEISEGIMERLLNKLNYSIEDYHNLYKVQNKNLKNLFSTE